MKSVDKYRFSLQWGAETAEKIQAGDFLNKLGNKKSEFIVLAVTEYLKAHPDIPLDEQQINIIVRPSVTHEQIEAMVKAAIREYMADIKPAVEKVATHDTVNLPDESNIDIMLKNLEMFTA